MKKTIIAFILGGIIFSSITATAAYVYTARDIGYQPSDENWNVSNASEALSSLKSDVNSLTQYRNDIVESLVDKGVDVNENSSMADIKNGIDNMTSEPESLMFDVIEYQQSGGDLFDYKNLYNPVDSNNPLFTVTGWSGNNYHKTFTLTSLVDRKVVIKGKYIIHKWKAGYNCFVEIKHNDTSLSRYDFTNQGTYTVDVDVEIDLHVGDTITLSKDQVFFSWYGVLNFY